MIVAAEENAEAVEVIKYGNTQMDESGRSLELMAGKIIELFAENRALKERIAELDVDHKWRIAYTPIGCNYYLWRCADCGAELRNESPVFPHKSCKNGDK